jgi:hypothetical protein
MTFYQLMMMNIFFFGNMPIRYTCMCSLWPSIVFQYSLLLDGMLYFILIGVYLCTLTFTKDDPNRLHICLIKIKVLQRLYRVNRGCVLLLVTLLYLCFVQESALHWIVRLITVGSFDISTLPTP